MSWHTLSGRVGAYTVVSKCQCLLFLQHLEKWNVLLCFLMFTCAWGFLTEFLWFLKVHAEKFISKNLAFSCLVTSSATDTFFQRSLRKEMLLYMVLIPIKEVTSSPWLGLLGVPLNSVLSFFWGGGFPLSFSHSSTRNDSKNKIQMFDPMTFPLSYLWSGPILWWENGKSLKAGAIHIHNLPSRTSIFKTSVKFYIYRTHYETLIKWPQTYFILSFCFIFLFSGWWK